MNILTTLILVLVFGAPIATLAGTKEAAPLNTAAPLKEPKAKDNTLEFEDELIEGETTDKKGVGIDAGRLANPIFMELRKDDAIVDSIVFRRSNFNDFHASDMKLRLHSLPVDSR